MMLRSQRGSHIPQGLARSIIALVRFWLKTLTQPYFQEYDDRFPFESIGAGSRRHLSVSQLAGVIVIPA